MPLTSAQLSQTSASDKCVKLSFGASKISAQVPQTIASDTLVLDVVPQGPQTSASSAPDECLKCPRRVPQVPQVPQTSAPSAPNECPKCPKRVPQVPQKSAPSAPVPQMRNKVVSITTIHCLMRVQRERVRGVNMMVIRFTMTKRQRQHQL